MQFVPHRITAADAGSMVESQDFAQHPKGFLRNLVNAFTERDIWRKREGWKKANKTAIPCDVICGAKAFRDKAGVLHLVIVGGDGNLYHTLGTDFSDYLAGTITDLPLHAVVMNDLVVWDDTAVASFAAVGNDLFIAVGSLDGVVMNIRYNATSGMAFGSVLTAPAAAPTAMASGTSTNPVAGTGGYLTAPLTAPTLAEVAGASEAEATSYQYCITFRDMTDLANLIESPGSPTATETLADPTTNHIRLTNIPVWAGVIPPGGSVKRVIYRAKYNGSTGEWGTFTYQDIILDNTTTIYNDTTHDGTAESVEEDGISPGSFTYKVTFMDVGSAGHEIESDQSPTVTVTIPNGSSVTSINLAAIPVSTQTAGRTIYREIYRSDDGQPFEFLAEIADNTTTTYVDTATTAPGPPYEQKVPMPVVKFFAALPNGYVAALYDVENGQPHYCYVSLDADHPEIIGKEQLVGTADDPITGVLSARGGIIVQKQDSIYYLDAKCEYCRRLIENVGGKSPDGMAAVGNVFYWLGAEGPAAHASDTPEEVHFAGPVSEKFGLSETWKTVNQDNLVRASVIHWWQRGIIAWAVQRCTAHSGKHNDTVLVWEYGMRGDSHPLGRMHIHTFMVDHFFTIPGDGASPKAVWGAFPGGFVGPLWTGACADGADTVLTGTGPIDYAALTLVGSGYAGASLWVWDGTGKMDPDDVCALPSARILSHTYAGMTFVEAPVLDATSKWQIGGYPWVLDRDGVHGGDLGVEIQIVRADAILKGADQ